MHTVINLDHGGTHVDTVVQSVTASIPKRDTIPIHTGDTLHDMTMRAYGHNSSENRAKILHANGNLDPATIGQIDAPR